MHLLLGSRPPQRPLSDAALLISLRRGQTGSFRYLYRRHYAAVQAYASQCMSGPLDAQEVTSSVFARLLQQTSSGESFVEGRHPGCLRPQLLGMVRTAAVDRWHREPHALSRRFRQWVAAGSQWPWGEDGQLALAYERLPAATRRLLWHSVVEGDDPALTARITGLARHEIPEACERALGVLRAFRADLYLERLERPDCRELFKRLQAQPGERPDEAAANHLSACPGCRNVYKDLVRLDERLAAQLPVRLLGWWPGREYLRAKAAFPVPLGDPPFLARLLERTDAQAPARPSALRRTARAARTAGAATGRCDGLRAVLSRRRPGRSPAALAIAGFLAGVVAGMFALSACDQRSGPGTPPPSASEPEAAPKSPPPRQSPGPPALSARFPVPAEAHTSQQGARAGDASGSRVLGNSSVLRYERVDFAAGGDGFARARLTGPPGGGAWIELTLDAPERPPLARIVPDSGGAASDVSVPISPVRGVHSVHVTARCPTAEPCVELQAFGTTPGRAP
ncbi:hypothetical protein QCN29_10705 [Streptomyces sp. HNM0663]|uniref:Uncharacterized protein n=1 Tax=Streptomyces chengmaiensis TaxID=3040919 RepID=A0ABT6HLN0_9ACTN|nr:hypothetical protein [Streptomyces chengmaiensis]MDH2389251.1 hypothetical protein [Streptomyces chengmaiensis]